MLSTKQLATLKKQLTLLQEELRGNEVLREHEVVAPSSLRDSVDELSTVDNHPADLATELYDREKDLALKVHSEALLQQVVDALAKMARGTYGLCAHCDQPIAYDRLRAIPYASVCMKDADTKPVPTDRPVEEDLLAEHPFVQRTEDAFQIVAQYGSSDTPADFDGDYADYHDVSNKQDEQSPLDALHLSAHDALGGQVSQAYVERARQEDYLD